MNEAIFWHLVIFGSNILVAALVDDCKIAGRTIVTRGTGYETLQVSKAITKVLQFLLKVLRPCTIFCFTFAHYS